VRHNIEIHFEKDYPTLSTWNKTTYNPHIADIHECIWKRALYNLATNSERAKRSGKRPGSTNEDLIANTKIEIQFAEKWTIEAMKDEKKIINLSRKMAGTKGGGGNAQFFA
jgi:hypothetical protein